MRHKVGENVKHSIDRSRENNLFRFLDVSSNIKMIISSKFHKYSIQKFNHFKGQFPVKQI